MRSKGVMNTRWFRGIGCALALVIVSGCRASTASQVSTNQVAAPARPARVEAATTGSPAGSPFLDRLVAAAIERTTQKVRYDPAYIVIPYPGGDVPAEIGVCTDEVIRAYRKVGVDLQKEVHEDMARNFRLYPKKWGLPRPDTNIDHRRVPNLMVFFERRGERLPVTADARDYRPGDIVTWDLGGGLTHIGIVVDSMSEVDRNRPLIVHNIGAGPQMEDVLFNWKITGHFRYEGQAKR